MPIQKGQAGIATEMHKFKTGSLHSGSSSGPIVKDRKQAIAIAMNKAGLSRKGVHSAKTLKSGLMSKG